MAEAQVNFYSRRLESLLLHETETFNGFVNQIQGIRGSLEQIGDFFRCRGNAESDAAFHTWVNDLIPLVSEMDDQVDQFIIQIDQQTESDRLALTERFRSELQKTQNHLAEIVHTITQINSPTMIEQDKKEKEDHEEEGQTDHCSNTILTECSTGELQKTQDHLAEIVHGITQLNVSTIIEQDKEEKDGEEERQADHCSNTIEGQEKEIGDHMEQFNEQQNDQTSSASSSVPFNLKYNNLPYYLKSSLLYCCIFPENCWIGKGKLIRLLVAEGLIQENTGLILEDVAEKNLNELISQGMLEVKDKHPGNGTKLTVSSPYRVLLQEKFTIAQADSDVNIPPIARRVLTSDLMKIGHNLSNLHPHSLFIIGNQEHVEENWLDLTWAKFLRVLDLEDTKIKSLPDEVEDLLHLTYLGLKHTNLTELPARIGRLRALQTLDIRWCGRLSALSDEIISLKRLRHLKMFKNISVSGVKLPRGIGRLRNLLTITGVHAGVAEELNELTQLRKLGVMDVSEENINQLSASISKMQGLLSLSLEAKCGFRENLFLAESFSPPPLLRKLRLEGNLEKVPSWFGLMENLTKIRLGFSHLSENPTLVLQLLPNLRDLTLWHAYDARQLGKEFCKAGGFPKLEVLSISSHVLEEWIELEEGALPSLLYLHFHNCLRLRMLPEGLQFVSTLKQLDLLPLLDEHAERLKPDGGEENHKIKNIPRISFIPMSLVSQLASSHPCHQIP
ncbi:disease resistance protein RPM1-like [Euphorbia lathyris]|uniref:disease resistance protein RPM1-like n=1 Tax=Euphorbia lathyris TaxID=212925 RepID=UPI00331315B2